MTRLDAMLRRLMPRLLAITRARAIVTEHCLQPCHRSASVRAVILAELAILCSPRLTCEFRFRPFEVSENEHI